MLATSLLWRLLYCHIFFRLTVSGHFAMHLPILTAAPHDGPCRYMRRYWLSGGTCKLPSKVASSTGSTGKMQFQTVLRDEGLLTVTTRSP